MLLLSDLLQNAICDLAVKVVALVCCKVLRRMTAGKKEDTKKEQQLVRTGLVFEFGLCLSIIDTVTCKIGA